jgi:hypothetical protein
LTFHTLIKTADGFLVGNVKVEVVGGGVFLLVDGVASGVGKVRVRLGIFLRLPASKIKDIGGWV